MTTTATANNIFDFDWFERSESQNLDNTRYSAYLFNEDIASNLICNMPDNNAEVAHKLHRFIAALVNKDINVCINDDDESYTDGKEIMVSSLAEWENVNNTFYSKLDTMLGLVLHETCHCMFTDFKIVQASSSEHWFLNVIEDETIENTLKNRCGGFAKFLDCVKYYYFDKNFDGNFTAENDFQEISNIFLNVIRYPKFLKNTLTDEQKAKYGSLFLSIYMILKRHHCLIKVNKDCSVNNTTNTKRNSAAVKEIIEEIKKFLKIDDKEFENQSSKAKETEGSAMGSEATKKVSIDDGSKESERLKKLLGSMMIDNGSSKTENDNTEEWERNLSDVNKNIKGKMLGDKHQYNKYYQWAYPNIQKASKIICGSNTKINYRTDRFNVTGQLDGACIGSAFIGNRFVCKQIKEEKKEQNNAKLAVVLMCDMSGSMSENHTAMKAGKFITLLSEAVSSIRTCELYVYTHNDIINCLVSNNYNKQKDMLGSIADKNTCGCQGECTSYKAIVEDVRTKTKLPICAINFTDSEYGNEPASIKQTVEELKLNNKTIVSCICLNERNMNEDNIAIYGENNYVNTCSTAPDEVQRVIKELATIIKTQYNKYIKK